MKSNGKHSVSQDDYLERILELIQRKGFARVVDLAADLGVREPSASTMVKRLAEAGLVKREAYRGFTLTPKGRNRAMDIQARHKVLASFFNAIGVDARTAARDIDGIEHHLSAKTVSALKQLTIRLKAS